MCEKIGPILVTPILVLTLSLLYIIVGTGVLQQGIHSLSMKCNSSQKSYAF